MPLDLAVLNDSLTVSSRTTDHPVESGSVITDHIIRDPDRVVFDIIINRFGDGSNDVPVSENRPDATWSRIRELNKNGDIFTLYTYANGQEYTDMALIEATVRGIGLNYEGRLTFKQILTAGVIEVPTTDVDTDKRASLRGRTRRPA